MSNETFEVVDEQQAAAEGGRLGGVCNETFDVADERAFVTKPSTLPPRGESEESRRDSGESKNGNPALGLSPPCAYARTCARTPISRSPLQKGYFYQPTPSSLCELA